MKTLAWDFLLYFVPCALLVGVLLDLSYERGYTVGKAAQPPVETVKLVQQDTDQMCTQWLFEANMKNVRKRMCGK